MTPCLCLFSRLERRTDGLHKRYGNKQCVCVCVIASFSSSSWGSVTTCCWVFDIRLTWLSHLLPPAVPVFLRRFSVFTLRWTLYLMDHTAVCKKQPTKKKPPKKENEAPGEGQDICCMSKMYFLSLVPNLSSSVSSAFGMSLHNIDPVWTLDGVPVHNNWN